MSTSGTTRNVVVLHARARYPALVKLRRDLPSLRPTPNVGEVALEPAADEVTAVASPLTAPPLQRVEVSGLALADGSAPRVMPSRIGAAWNADARAIASDVLAKLDSGSLPSQVRQAMELLLALPALRRADVSCTVLDAHGAPLVDHRAAVPTNPCSNAKVVTAAFALSVLGPGHRFSTTLSRAPDGAVVVTGRFDPTMTRAAIDELARALAAQGLTAIPRLILDVSALQGTNVPASFAKYGDEDWEYLARPEPLSVDKNIVKLTVTPGAAPGEPARVVADTDAFAVRARVQTVAPQTEFKVGCNELDNGGVLERDASGRALLDVWGTVAADYAKGKTLVMKSPAPLEQVGFAWKDAFERAGIAVGDVEVGGPVAGATPIHEHRSKPLATILETSLATSNAFDHEMLALAAAHAQAGAPVTLAEAARRLTAFLRSLGVEGVLVNGSGIGNESKVPARAIATLLARAKTDARLAPLLEGLARPGLTGTLKGRMLDTAAEGAFAGKTGTGEGAVALSGLAGDVVMSVLVEHMTSRRDHVRAALDAVAIVLSTLRADRA